MVEELEADAATNTSVRGTANAASSVKQGGVAVFACASCCSQDVEERVDGLFTLAPEDLACFLRS